MQGIAERNPAAVPPKVLVFRTRMGVPVSTPPDGSEANPTGFHAPTHGNWAQWVSAAIAGIALLGVFANVALTFYFHYAAGQAQISDEHTDSRIDAKLTPAVKAINDGDGRRFDGVADQIGKLNDRMARVEQRLDDLHADLKKQSLEQEQVLHRLNQNEALARLRVDPSDTLDKIRRDLQVAEAKKEEIPYGKLVDYKAAVHGLPPSAADYWRTVAAIINYESFIEQTRGHAPNPATVSHPCPMTTASPSFTNNLISGYVFMGCIVDLDTSTTAFDAVTFVNCVVRYHGGKVAIRNVQFKNCTFQLDISEEAPPVVPERDRILLAMLDAPTLRDVTVTLTH